MTKIPQSAALLKTPAAAPDTHDADAPMTDPTAATLRELCLARDEPFDAELTEVQARQRIEAMENRG
jgi:hypothetical protein